MKKLFRFRYLYYPFFLLFATEVISNSQASDTIKTLQPESPKIQWVSPVSVRNVLRSPEETVKATVRSSAGLNGVQVFLNGTLLGEPEMRPSNNIIGNFYIEKKVRFETGENNVYIEAANNGGTTRSETRYFLLQNTQQTGDPELPFIQWTNPLWKETSLRSQETIIKASIKSSAGLSSVFLYLNGVLYGEPIMKPSPSSAGYFNIEKNIRFDPGEYNVYIEATNSKGSVKSETRHFTYLTENKDSVSFSAIKPGYPVISWTNPTGQNSTVKSTELNIKATVKSPSGLNSVFVFLNDASSGEPEMKPSPNVPGNFYITKTLKLKTGENTVYIVAANNLGETYSEKRSIIVPEEITSEKPTAVLKIPAEIPVITWTNPATQSMAMSSPMINLTAYVKSSTGLSSVMLYLNGASTGEAEVEPSTDANTGFIAEKTLSLQPGENKVYIAATNSSGTAKSEVRTLIVPEEQAQPVTVLNQDVQKQSDSAIRKAEIPPVISWTSPSKLNTTLSSSDLVVRAMIKTSSGLNSVRLYINGVSAGEPDMKPSPTAPGTFIVEKAIKFEPGQSNIYLEAENNGGSAKSEIRYFTNPFATPPVNQLVQKTEPAITEQMKPEPIKPEQSSIEPARKPEPVPPVVTWVSPSAARTTMDSFNATVKANVKSGSGINSVLLYLNGVSKGETEIKASPDNAADFLVEKNVNFGPGENNIYLVVTSRDGITAKSEIRYFTNPSAILPEVGWSIPASPNSIVGTENFVISASIKSPTELKSVKLYVNADVQSEDNVFDETAAAANGTYNWENSVLLRKGENSIYIVAMNAAGSTRSEKRVIRYEEALTEKRLALVFGNSQYNNKAPLRNPVNDANLMEATLKDLGFDVIKRLDAKRDEMMGAIREFNEKLPDYNIALFYYAGHGNQVDGKNYLIPTDAVLSKPGDCKFEAIGIDFIVEEFERYPDNTNIVILDACRDNPFATWSRGEASGFRQISFSSGTIVVFATSEGATAADGKGDNGLFTQVLVKQMLIPQSIFSVLMKTRVEVKRLSNNQQIPMEWNKLNGDFYFRK